MNYNIDFYKYDEILRTVLTTSEERVYRTIMSFRNNLSNEAFPSQDVIVSRTNISLSTVKRAIKGLVKKDFLSIRKMKKIIGHYNTYIMKYIPHSYKEKEGNNGEYSDISNGENSKINKINEENNILNEENQGENTINSLDCLENFQESDFNKLLENDRNSNLIEGKTGLILTKWQNYIANTKLEYEVILQTIGLFRKKKGRTYAFFLRLYINFIPSKNLTKEFLADLKIYDIMTIN